MLKLQLEEKLPLNKRLTHGLLSSTFYYLQVRRDRPSMSSWPVSESFSLTTPRYTSLVTPSNIPSILVYPFHGWGKKDPKRNLGHPYNPVFSWHLLKAKLPNFFPMDVSWPVDYWPVLTIYMKQVKETHVITNFAIYRCPHKHTDWHCKSYRRCSDQIAAQLDFLAVTHNAFCWWLNMVMTALYCRDSFLQ